MTTRLLIILVSIIFSVNTLQAQNNDLGVFESINSGVAFEYPPGWMVLEDFDNSPIVIINDISYLDGNGQLESGQIRIDILTLPPTPLYEPTELLEYILEDSPTISDMPISEVNIGNRPASYFELTNSDLSRVAVAYQLEENTQPILIFISTTVEDTERLLPSALDVIETMTTFPPELEDVVVDTQNLTETYIATDNSFTFNYPIDWEYTVTSHEDDDNFQLMLTNRARLHPSTNWPDSIFLRIDKISQQDNIETFPFDEVLRFIEGARLAPEGAQPTRFSLNGRNAAYVEIDDDVSSGIFLVVALNNDTFIIIMILSAPDTLDELRPIILGIAQTLELAPPELSPALPLTQSYTNSDASYTLMYPEDWFIQPIESRAVTVITNTENFEPQALQSGNIIMTLSVAPIEDAEPSDYIDIVLAMSSASYGEPIEVQIGGRDAIRLEAFENNRISFITLPTENHIAILNVSIDEDYIPQYNETLIEILESITVLEE